MQCLVKSYCFPAFAYFFVCLLLALRLSCSSSFVMNVITHQSKIIPAPETIPKPKSIHPQTFALAASLGAPLPTSPCPLTVAVQLAPHSYPDGQHPPPTLAGQLDHPLAHLPVLAVELLPVGAAIVSPVLVTTAVLAEAGQLVLSQSRPTRQHPPR